MWCFEDQFEIETTCPIIYVYTSNLFHELWQPRHWMWRKIRVSDEHLDEAPANLIRLGLWRSHSHSDPSPREPQHWQSFFLEVCPFFSPCLHHFAVGKWHWPCDFQLLRSYSSISDERLSLETSLNRMSFVEEELQAHLATMAHEQRLLKKLIPWL